MFSSRRMRPSLRSIHTVVEGLASFGRKSRSRDIDLSKIQVVTSNQIPSMRDRPPVPTETIQRLPLFLISEVVFPDVEIPLRVFEPRYLAMLDEIMKRPDRLFGIGTPRVFEDENIGALEKFSPSRVGTVLRVESVKNSADKSKVIVARSLYRYQLSGNIHFEKVEFRPGEVKESALVQFGPYGYWTANVQAFDDQRLEDRGDLLELSILTNEVRGYVDRFRDSLAALQQNNASFREIPGQSLPSLSFFDTLPKDPVDLSFVLANLLPGSPRDKLKWLSSSSTTDRLSTIEEFLRVSTKRLEQISQAVAQFSRGQGRS